MNDNGLVEFDTIVAEIKEIHKLLIIYKKKLI